MLPGGCEFVAQADSSSGRTAGSSFRIFALEMFGILSLLNSMGDPGDFSQRLAASVGNFLGVLALQLCHFGAAPFPARAEARDGNAKAQT